MLDGFARDPAWFFEDERWDHAVVALSDYFARYEGSWFDRLADHDHPCRITARDIVAVSMLEVQIPAKTAIWLLGDGAAEVTSLLERIPLDWVIWQRDADLTRDGAAWRLWNAIDRNWWPVGSADPGMGPTKISKLMAAKRPNLVPIQDSLVRRGVFGDKEPADYWKHWHDLHMSAHGEALRRLAERVRAEAGVGAHLSVLRVIDIVIWCWVDQHRQDFPVRRASRRRER
jgi:Family of unknown function (DUF6308)